MNKKDFYIVGYFGGDWESDFTIVQFVTENEELAIKWKEKYDRLLYKMEQFYRSKLPLDESEIPKLTKDDRENCEVFYSKYGKIEDTIGAYYEKKELR